MSSIRLYPEDSRLTTFPLYRPNLFKWYEDALSCFWTPHELSLSADVIHYETKLTEGERIFVKHVLAFFAASDGIVNLNLAKRFKDDVPILEVGYFYDFQIVMENIHAHTYSLLLDTIVPTEKEFLLNAIKTIPVITEMSVFMLKTIDSTASFAERLLRMACVEGIFFTGCFCVIYWLQNRGLMPALGHSNELIARDEALHTMFAIYLYDLIDDSEKLPADKICDIFVEAVNLAKKFIDVALTMDLPEMNSNLMYKYIESQADNLVTLISDDPIYNSKHEFHFMDQINLTNRTNFFERRVSEYAKSRGSHDNNEYNDDF